MHEVVERIVEGLVESSILEKQHAVEILMVSVIYRRVLVSGLAKILLASLIVINKGCYIDSSYICRESACLSSRACYLW